MLLMVLFDVLVMFWQKIRCSFEYFMFDWLTAWTDILGCQRDQIVLRISSVFFGILLFYLLSSSFLYFFFFFYYFFIIFYFFGIVLLRLRDILL
jgi:hypothetical protein